MALTVDSSCFNGDKAIGIAFRPPVFNTKCKYLNMVRENNLLELYLALCGERYEICYPYAYNAAMKGINSHIEFIIDKKAHSEDDDCLVVDLEVHVIGTKKGLIRWNNGDKALAEKNFVRYLLHSKQHYLIEYISEDVENRLDMLLRIN